MHEVALSPAEEEEKIYKILRKCADSNNNIPTIPTIGKLQLGLMCSQPPYAVAHDAMPLLQEYAKKGCPVNCGDNWSYKHIVLMLQRGPHWSSLSKKDVRQLRQETLEKV